MLLRVGDRVSGVALEGATPTLVSGEGARKAFSGGCGLQAEEGMPYPYCGVNGEAAMVRCQFPREGDWKAELGKPTARD